jgi:hypothetical protein
MTRIEDTLQTDSLKVELWKPSELLQDIKLSETLWSLVGTSSRLPWNWQRAKCELLHYSDECFWKEAFRAGPCHVEVTFPDAENVWPTFARIFFLPERQESYKHKNKPKIRVWHLKACVKWRHKLRLPFVFTSRRCQDLDLTPSHGRLIGKEFSGKW